MNNLLSIATLSENLYNVLTDNLGIWYLIILNGIGVIAIILKILEYQVPKRETMFIITLGANICWVLYFALYCNFASTLTCFVNVIKMLIFMQRGKHKWADSVWWLILFLVLQTGVAVFTVRAWFDIFAVVAGYLGILSYFFVNPKIYRALSFIHMSTWVISGLVNIYPIAIISDSVSTISCGVAIWRYDIRKNGLEKNAKNEEKIDAVIENEGN